MKPTRLNLTYGIAWLTCVLTATSHAALNIPDVPIFLTSTGVPPNIVLTLDDSGSMARAYTPDLCGASMLGCNSTSESQASDDYHLATRSAKSSYKNPMYYNPNVIYRAPVNAAGTALAYGPDPTNYPMRAYINGYYTAAGYVDLDTSYRATAWYWLGASDPGEATAEASQAAALDALGARASAQQRLRTLVRHHFEVLLGAGSDFIPVMLYEWRSLDAAQQQEVRALKDAYEATWMPVLRALHRAGRLKARPEVARLFIFGALNWAVQWFSNGGKLTLDELTRQALLLFTGDDA